MLLGARPAPHRTSRRTALAIALLFGFTSAATIASPAPTLAWDGNSFDASSEAELVALTNRSRASAGLKALKVDSALVSIARWRSKDMIERDYFSHSIPGYGKVFDKLDASGYCYKLAGENIGWNTWPDADATGAIHQMFMDSSGHRANILGDTWDVIGIGAYKGAGDKKMWTVLFADKCSAEPHDPEADRQAHAEADPKAHPEADPQAHASANAAPHAGSDARTHADVPRRPRTADARRRHPRRPRRRRRPDADADTDADAARRPTPTPTPEFPAVRLRVVEPAPSQSLLEMIVTGVTAFFFGA